MREKGQTEVAKTLETPVFSRGIEILTEKIQFTSPIICKYPDGTYYSLGLLGFIDRALSENSTCHLTLNPDDEFDAWFLYEASRYSHDKTYYLRGSFQNYIDDDSYTGYLVELNDIEDVE